MVDHDGVTPAATSSVSETGLPVPRIGAGSRELATDSTDPAELRHDLLLAKERLAFYESFDRVIGENIRRSGELMLERIALREESEAREHAAAAAEAARRIAAEREHAARTQLLAGLLAEIDRIGGSLDALRNRLVADLTAIEDEPEAAIEPDGIAHQAETGGETHAERAPEFVPDVPVIEPRETDVPTLADGRNEVDTALDPSGIPGVPLTFDVLVHGVSRAAVAVSLQRYLNALATISNVETREFAEGILRLTITSTQANGLSEVDIAGWRDAGTLSIQHTHPNAIELTIS